MRRVASGALMVVLLSNLLFALPSAGAATSVVVTMPKGAGLAAGGPGYSPDVIKVVIGVNNTVTWTNNDTVAHTVTPSVTPPGATWSVGSGNMNSKDAYSFTFTVPGIYNYSCAYHSWMFGSVIVKLAASSTSSSSSSSTKSTSTTSSVPEFPAAWLSMILLVAVAVAALVGKTGRRQTQIAP